jgi:hypothetical protein
MSKGPGKFFLYIGWALPDELKPSSQLTSPQAWDIIGHNRKRII